MSELPGSPMPAMEDPVERILAYHQRSKHHLQQYARSPGYLDWETQPDPFRTYAGALVTPLPFAADRLATAYDVLYLPKAAPAQPLSIETLGIFFELALGLSAWKQHQSSRWALRCNPSSGNLHPTEGYAILPEVGALPAGVYHYVSRDHCLERRCTWAKPQAATDNGWFAVGLTSIHWREAWKYGERAYRYCQHDAGHALATCRLAAAALGWSARLVDTASDEDVAAILGLDRETDYAGVAWADREHPDALLLIRTFDGPTPADADLPTLLRRGVAAGTWGGTANPLSPRHVDWSVIDEAAAAARKPNTGPAPALEVPTLPALVSTGSPPASKIIRQRRSCLALDGKTSISDEAFFGILERLLPRANSAPWDMLPWEPLIHLALFVHRVRGLTPGLYVFERNAAVHERLRAAFKPDFRWQRPARCPGHLRLFMMAEADCRRAAESISCHQDIAADGAFSLGMLADFAETIRGRGPWWYRRLFWEAGIVGQVLYLEAESAGIRGTGIGCYFDDACHDVLGLHGEQFQDLYHFTLGGPVNDPRLTTLPAYGHLRRPS